VQKVHHSWRTLFLSAGPGRCLICDFLLPHSLRKNNIGDKGAAAIAKGFTHNMTLTKLK
jgi:hypothetical protein